MDPSLLLSFGIGEYERRDNDLQVRQKGKKDNVHIIKRLHAVAQGAGDKAVHGLVYRIYQASSGCKNLAFSSAVCVSNMTDVPLELEVKLGSKRSGLIKIPAGKCHVAMPIEFVGSGATVRVRPGGGEKAQWSASLDLKAPVERRQKSNIQAVHCQLDNSDTSSFFCHAQWDENSPMEAEDALIRTLSFRPGLTFENMLPVTARLITNITKEAFALEPGGRWPLPCVGGWGLEGKLSAVVVKIQCLDRLSAHEVSILHQVFERIDVRGTGLVQVAYFEQYWQNSAQHDRLLSECPKLQGITPAELKEKLSHTDCGTQHEQHESESISLSQFVDAFRFGPSTVNHNHDAVLCYHEAVHTVAHYADRNKRSESLVAEATDIALQSLASTKHQELTDIGLQSLEGDAQLDAIKHAWSTATAEEAILLPLERTGVEFPIRLSVGFQLGDIMLQLWSPVLINNLSPYDIELSTAGRELALPKQVHEHHGRQDCHHGDATAFVLSAPDDSIAFSLAGGGSCEPIILDDFDQEAVRVNLQATDSAFVFRGLIDKSPAPPPFTRSQILTIRPIWLAKNCSSHDLVIERSVADFEVLEECTATSTSGSHVTLTLKPHEILNALAIQEHKEDGDERAARICFSRDSVAFWCPLYKKKKRLLFRMGDFVVARYVALTDVRVRRAFVESGKVIKKKLKLRRPVTVLPAGAEVDAIETRKDQLGQQHVKLRLNGGDTGWAALEVTAGGLQLKEVPRDAAQVAVVDQAHVGSVPESEVLRQGQEAAILTQLCPAIVEDAIRLKVRSADGVETHLWSSSFKLPSSNAPEEEASSTAARTLMFRIPSANPAGLPVHILVVIPSTGIVVFKDAASTAPFKVVNYSAATLEYKVAMSKEPWWQVVGPGLTVPLWTDSEDGHIGVEVRQLDNPEAKSFDIGAVRVLDKWECGVGVHICPAIVLVEGVKSLVFRDDVNTTRTTIAALHQPLRSTSSMFFEMQGFQLSFVGHKNREWARLHAEHFGYASEPSGLLHVTILKAEELPAHDVFTQSNDAFCELEVDGEERSTHIISTTKLPRWAKKHALGALGEYSFHFCARATDRLRIRVCDDDATEQELIGICDIKLDSLAQIPDSPHLVGAAKTLSLHLEDEPAGKLYVLLAFEANPVTSPQLVKFHSSAIKLDDKLTPSSSIGRAATTTIVQLGGSSGLSLTHKSCLSDCLGQKVAIPHIKALTIDVGKLHLGCTTLFLGAVCDCVASILPLMAQDVDHVRVGTARSALCLLNAQQGIPEALTDTDASLVYCEENGVIEVRPVKIVLAVEIDDFVRDLDENAALIYMCEAMGTSLAAVTGLGEISGCGMKIGLPLLSQLVTIHLTIGADGFEMPQNEDGKLVVSTVQLLNEATAEMVSMGPKLFFAVMSAVIPNPFQFITSRVKSGRIKAVAGLDGLIATALDLADLDDLAVPEVGSDPRTFGPDGELLPRGLAAWRSWPALDFHLVNSLVRVHGGRDGQTARIQQLQADYAQKQSLATQNRIMALADRQDELEHACELEEAEAEAADAKLAQAEAQLAKADGLLTEAAEHSKVATAAADKNKAKLEAAREILADAKNRESRFASTKSRFMRAKEWADAEHATHDELRSMFNSTVRETMARQEEADLAAVEAKAQMELLAAQQAATLLEQENLEAELAHVGEVKAKLAAKLAEERAAVADYEEKLAGAVAEAMALAAARQEALREAAEAADAAQQAEEHRLEVQAEAARQAAQDHDAKAARLGRLAAVEQDEADAAIAAAAAAKQEAAEAGTSEAEAHYCELAAQAEIEIADAKAAKVAAEEEQHAAKIARAEADAARVDAEEAKVEATLQHDRATQAREEAESSRKEADAAAELSVVEHEKASAAHAAAEAAEAESRSAQAAAAAAAADAESARVAMEAKQAEAAAAQDAANRERVAAEAAGLMAKEAAADAEEAHAKARKENAEAQLAIAEATESRVAAAAALVKAEQQQRVSQEAVARAEVEEAAAKAAEEEAKEARVAAEEAKKDAVKERNEAVDARKEMEEAAAAREREEKRAKLPQSPPRDGMLTVTIVGCAGLLASDHSAFGIDSSDPCVTRNLN